MNFNFNKHDRLLGNALMSCGCPLYLLSISRCYLGGNNYCVSMQVCLVERWLAMLLAECSVATVMATDGVAEAGARAVGDLEVGDRSAVAVGAALVDLTDENLITFQLDRLHMHL